MHGSLNSLNLYANSQNKSAGDSGLKNSLNNSWNGVWGANKVWGDDQVRKPVRLEALPALDSKENKVFNKGNFNTLDLI